MTIIVGNIRNVFIEEVKHYLEDKIDCSVSIAGDQLIGHINDAAIAKYTQEKLRLDGEKWLKEISTTQYDWSD